MRYLFAALAVSLMLGMIPGDAAAICCKPPKVEKMLKPPCCCKKKKIGEEYMGKCAAVDPSPCCKVPKAIQKCKCCPQ